MNKILYLFIKGKKAGEFSIYFLPQLCLGLSSYPSDGQKGINGRPSSFGKQVAVKKYVPVGHRHDIRLDVAGKIALQALYYRDAGNRGFLFVQHKIPRSFQKARVHVKNVSRVGIAPGKALSQKRNLPIILCMGGEIVKNNENVLSAIAEILGNSHARVGS